jgi:uncharacterized protein
MPSPDQAANTLPAVAEHIESLDVLRGVALLGILLVNIEFFTRPIQAVALGFDDTLQGLDHALGLAIHILLQGKFYSLFSMLFGMGFAIMAARAAAQHEAFFLRYARRILVLGAIGLLHALYVWSGDILLSYALFGSLLLLFFRRMPATRLPIWAGVFLAAPLALLWLLASAMSGADVPPEVAADFHLQHEAFVDAVWRAELIFAQGSFAEVSAQRLDDLDFMLSSLAFFGIGILGYFLIGVWFVRSGLILNCTDNLPWFRRVAALGIAFGLPLCIAGFWLMRGQSPMLPTPAMAAASTLTTLGNLLMSLAYLSAIVLLLHQPRWHDQLQRLAPAGRMALSNYLLQSLIWTWAFYAYGLGLYGQVPRWGMALAAVLFFALQVLASQWWLARFRIGPLEWLWRALTYLSLPRLRR